MGTIALEGLKFHGYHGVHESERKNGNSFEIDLELEVDFQQAAEKDDVNLTVDYEEVYKIVKKQLKGSSYLLEHIANKILDALFDRYPNLEKASVKVSKLNPPVGGECKRASVKLSR